jgi:mannosyl-3-phosphoglycerate phosphatase
LIARVVFTDLDGTLLDHHDYGFEPALGALESLKAAGIPVVLCSSKTEAEIRMLQREMGVRAPLICENGGAVVLDQGESPLVIGTAVGLLGDHLEAMATELGIRVRTLVEMTVGEIEEITGLPEARARLARERAYSLPFLLERESADWEGLRREARRRGLEVSRGGRFFHLTGGNNKGEAARLLLLHWERRQGRRPASLGLGDSQNDLELLREVDVPVRIPNPWSDAPLGNELAWGIACELPGPRGWSAAVLAWLRREGLAGLAEEGGSGLN